MKKIFVLLLALTMVLMSLTSCGLIGNAILGGLDGLLEGLGTLDLGDLTGDLGDLTGDGGGGFEGNGSIVPATDSGVWPSGVYSYFGIPDYTAGTISYAVPGDNLGTVMLISTREELVAYVNQLLEAGFRIDAEEVEDVGTRVNSGFEAYLPEFGSGYSMSCYYDFARNITEERWDDENSKTISVTYNIMFTMSQNDSAERDIEDGLLVEFGIANDKLVTDAMHSIDRQRYTLSDTAFSITLAIDHWADYYIGEEQYNEVLFMYYEALTEVSEGGVLYSSDGATEYTLDAAKEAKPTRFNFKYQGGTYKVTVAIPYFGYDQTITIAIVTA